MKRAWFLIVGGILGFTVVGPLEVPACTRAVYKGPDGMVMTGRTMDFAIDIPANLWLFPRGMARSGQTGPRSLEWTSRYEQQLAIRGYWETIPGTLFLPGSNRPVDRFVRASYYLNAIPQTADRRIAVASLFSLMRNVSVPYGIGTPDQPHISSTRWRVVADQKHRVYYFENVLTPNVFWVDLARADFRPGQPVRKLSLDSGEVHAGDALDSFQDAEPFEFAGL